MNTLVDVINYIRRLVKTSSNDALSDNTIIDYINRFWIMDVDARVQLFDLKTNYSFQTTPGTHQYNMPLYGVNGFASGPEPGGQTTSYYPVYQGFLSPCYVNGILSNLYTERNSFYNVFPTYTQAINNSFEGDGGNTYTLSLPFFPALKGHVDMAGIIAVNSSTDPITTTSIPLNVPKENVHPAIYVTTLDANNNTVVVSDTGQFWGTNVNLGLLAGAVSPTWGTSTNVVNYNTGSVNVTFSTSIPAGNPINVQCYFYQQGIPRGLLFYNNVITVMPPPDISYNVDLTAYLTPAAFLSTGQSLPFAYMAEYIARGAARKILSDNGDIEQFSFYEPLFREQEMLVWKRSQRQFTSTRTPTIFSDSSFQAMGSNAGQGM